MSSPLSQFTATINYPTTQPVNTSTGAAYASTSCVVTDSTGVAQPAVNVTPANPTFNFSAAAVAGGLGALVATDVDVNGAVLNQTSTPFTEVGSPPTFSPNTGATITPVGGAAAAAAKARAAAAVKK